MGASGKTVEELEKMCEDLAIKNRIMKDRLREVSKFINKHIINA